MVSRTVLAGLLKNGRYQSDLFSRSKRNDCLFNEAEAVCDLNAAEPEDLELKSPKQPKRKGKKEADLSGLPVRRIDHYLSAEELEAEFGVRVGNSYRMPFPENIISYLRR